MEEILKEINELVKFCGLSEIYGLGKAMSKESSQLAIFEEKDEERFEEQKEKLIQVIDAKLSGIQLKSQVEDIDKAKRILENLKGRIKTITFMEMPDIEIDIETDKLAFMKERKDKTLEEQIDINVCENEIHKLERDKELKKMKMEDRMEKEKNRHYGKKRGFKSKILSFFRRLFHRQKRLPGVVIPQKLESEQQWENEQELEKKIIEGTEDYIDYADQDEQEIVDAIKDIRREEKITFDNEEKIKKQEELRKQKELDEQAEQVRKYFESAQRAKEGFRKRNELYSNGSVEWKNGNYVVENNEHKSKRETDTEREL